MVTTKRTRSEVQTEALARATQSDSFSNYPAIYSGLMAMGIPEADIEPRVNVFTYHAWRAKGRQVRRHEHGVRITTWIPISGKCRTCAGAGCGKCKGSGTYAGKRPKSATVFHVSQTEPG